MHSPPPAGYASRPDPAPDRAEGGGLELSHLLRILTERYKPIPRISL
jgi:hypothetical protein